MDHRHSYDIERRQELHNEIDKLPVPDDHSNSDISGEYTPNRSRVDRAQTPEGESFSNSINSPIPQGSPELQFDPRESETEFTQQQVNKVMDWSQTHITPSEGRFPQVSAPTMEIESETNEFELVEGFNEEPVSAVEHAEDSLSKDKSLEFEAIRASDLPMTRQVPRKAKESLTFSPSRQQAQPWFFTPGGRRPSKHSLPHSGNTSEVIGSALLSGPNQSHQGDSAYKTALDHSVMQDEVYKLKTANTQIRAALKAEQEEHLLAEKALGEVQKELEDKLTLLEDARSQCALMKAKTKDSSSLEELRGRHLELARAELARIKAALADRDSEIVALKHTLSQKLTADSPNSREKEIEDMTLEISKLKIVTTAANKKAAEAVERAQGMERLKNQVEIELNKAEEEIGEIKRELAMQTAENQKVTKELALCKDRLKECEGGVNSRGELLSREQQEIQTLKLVNDSLKKEIEELREGATPLVDYDTQFAKMRRDQEATISKLKRQGDEVWLKKAEEWKSLEHKLRSEIEELKEVAAECEADYKEELNKASMAVNSERDKVLSLSRENRRLQTNLQEAQEEAAGLIGELESCREARDKAEEAAEKLRKTAGESPRNKRGSRRPSIDPQKIDEFLTQIEALKIEQERIMRRADTDKLHLEQELTQTSLERNDLKDELAELRSEYSGLRHENAEMRKKLDPRRREMTLSEEFDAKLSEMGVSKPDDSRPSVGLQTSFEEPAPFIPEEIEMQLRDGEAAIETVAILRQEKTALIAKLQKVTEIRSTLCAATDTEDLEVELETDNEVSELRAECKAAEDEVRRVRQNTEDREEELKEEIHQLNEEIGRWQEDLTAAQQELQQRDEELRESKEKFEMEMGKMEGKLKKFREEMTNMKREYEQQIAEMQSDFQTEIEEYKKRQTEMASLHDQFRKATTQQTQDDLLQTLRDKDEEWQTKMRQHEDKQKAIYEEKLMAKEKELQELKSQLNAQFEQAKAELAEKIREEGVTRLDKSKQDQTRMKREHDREIRKLQEELDHVTDRTRQQLELEFIAKLNAEKKEADRKSKAKVKVLQEKHLQDLATQEALLKVQFDKSIADAVKTVTDQNRTVLRQREAEFVSEIDRLKQEHEDAMRQLAFEKSQLQAECERRIKHIPSLEGSLNEFPFGRSRDFRASKSGFQDSVLTINDFRPDESEILTWTQAHTDRTGMLKEDLRSYWVEEAGRRLEQKLIEKAKIQKFVETQCKAARESEQTAVLQTLAEEFDRLTTGTGPRPRAQHKDLAGRLQAFLARLKEKVGAEYEGRVKELKTAQDAIVQKYRAKVGQLETALLQKTKKEPSPLPPDTDLEDSVFVRLGGHLYISLKCTVDDLALVCESFDAAIAPKKPAKRGLKTMDPDASLEKQKDTYRSLLNALQRSAADVSWALRNQVKERTLTHESATQCSLGDDEANLLAQEYEEKLTACHHHMDEMEARYKHSLQDATGSLSNLSELKQEWEAEKEALEAELLTAKDKLREWEESPALIPEMLSPSETCELVFSIFNRSNRETFLRVMTDEHPQFLTLLQEFVEATVDL